MKAKNRAKLDAIHHRLMLVEQEIEKVFREEYPVKVTSNNAWVASMLAGAGKEIRDASYTINQVIQKTGSTP